MTKQQILDAFDEKFPCKEHFAIDSLQEENDRQNRANQSYSDQIQEDTK